MRLWIILLVLAIFLSGCKTLREKFIRKPRQSSTVVKAPEKDFEVDPRLVYERHFVFAKVWMDEFKNSLDSLSRKRQRESWEEAIKNLEILYDYIPEAYSEKKERLKKIISDLRQVYGELVKLQRARLPLTRVKQRIEEIRREFHVYFLPRRQPEGFFSALRVN